MQKAKNTLEQTNTKWRIAHFIKKMAKTQRHATDHYKTDRHVQMHDHAFLSNLNSLLSTDVHFKSLYSARINQTEEAKSRKDVNVKKRLWAKEEGYAKNETYRRFIIVCQITN